jgi:hypothetical protein
MSESVDWEAPVHTACPIAANQPMAEFALCAQPCLASSQRRVGLPPGRHFRRGFRDV